MRYVRLSLATLVAFALLASCAPKSGGMTPEKFLMIEEEVMETDLTPESKEAVVKKYDISLKEYEDYAQKVESDPQLKEKVGEARLKKSLGGSN